MKPLVSILIPNYNKAPFLIQTLTSIISQTYQNWECIIVDDHSTDESWEILQEFKDQDSRFKVFSRPSDLPKGGNTCRNLAFELSKGDFIQWFDSDDIYIAESFELRINFILRQSKLDFVIFSGNLFKNNLDEIIQSYHLNWDESPSIYSLLKLKPDFLPQSILFRRSFLIDQRIYWNEDLRILQDVLFSVLVLSKSKNFGNSKIKDWYWRIHDDGRNVGSKRTDPQNLDSFKLFITEVYKLIDGEIDKVLMFRNGLYKIIYSTLDLLSLKWYQCVVLNFYKNKLISNFQFFILTLFAVIIFPFKRFRFFSIFKLGYIKVCGFVLIN